MFTISEDDFDYLIISLSMLTLQTRAINYIPGGALKLRVKHKHSYLGRVASSQGGQLQCPTQSQQVGPSLPTVGNVTAG